MSGCLGDAFATSDAFAPSISHSAPGAKQRHYWHLRWDACFDRIGGYRSRCLADPAFVGPSDHSGKPRPLAWLAEFLQVMELKNSSNQHVGVAVDATAMSLQSFSGS